MNTQRLTTLANFLRTVPPERFDLTSWRSKSPSAHAYKMGATNVELESDCGTTACAIGWACAMPEFQIEGLRWGGDNPMCGMRNSWSAVTHFFSISEDDAIKLFVISSYTYLCRQATATDVADKIDLLVTEYVAAQGAQNAS